MKRREDDLATKATAGPNVSIVIPTFRRTAMLVGLLAELSAQIKACVGDEAATVEVIVADNCPSASARQACEAARVSIPRLVYVQVETAGVVHARNAGVDAAAGAYVIFLDDDEVPRPGWLASWLAQAAKGTRAAFGPIVPRYESEPTAYRAILDRMFSRHFDLPTGGDISAEVVRLGTGNSMFNRGELNGAKTFDSRFNLVGGEDMHMIFQIADRGVRLVWNQAAAVDEVVPVHRMTAEYLKQRRFNQAQLRCILALSRGGGLAWPRLLFWMIVGVAQTVVSGSLYLLSLVRGTSDRQVFEIQMQGGLGKVFWYRNRGLSPYAAQAS
jgi:succinoglycan biosynthesis protein ExoM